LLLESESPGPDKESNWLPSPPASSISFRAPMCRRRPQSTSYPTQNHGRSPRQFWLTSTPRGAFQIAPSGLPPCRARSQRRPLRPASARRPRAQAGASHRVPGRPGL